MTKNDFYRYLAQTSPQPLALEIDHAKGSYIYDTSGKAYLDFVAGVSANTLGHSPKSVIQALHKQIDTHLHVMVYGEFIQKPQNALGKLLIAHLPEGLDTVYFTNSGTEATEGALKLAKRITGRQEIISAINAYHGNTQGAMSVAGVEHTKSAFRPLIPGTRFIRFNNRDDLNKITTDTAAVILETIQGGAGFITPDKGYLSAVKKRCEQTGSLLILDEIQSGMGRTGSLFEFMQHHIVPDILITGKGLGGGMPIGAFVSSKEHMQLLTHDPSLGHITTFGGHPVIAAAAEATLREILDSGIMEQISRKEKILREGLQHPLIQEIRGKGLMLALMMSTGEIATQVILRALDKGLILFWLLFEPRAVRITPPLNISEEDLYKGIDILLESMDDVFAHCDYLEWTKNSAQ
jgi:acetylornithine/succinyldiaminopimelate/putrescine aminotransferase